MNKLELKILKVFRCFYAKNEQTFILAVQK